MKKVLLMLLVILLPLITACGNNEDVTHAGVNAEILEISNVVKGMVVKGLDNNSILGDDEFLSSVERLH